MSFECSICLGVHADADGYSAIRCGHVFHTSCIFRWLATGKVCPECRVPSSKSAATRLYLKFASATQGNTSILESNANDTGNWIEKCHAKEIKCQEQQRELDALKEKIEQVESDLNGSKDALQKASNRMEKMTKEVYNSRENQKLINAHRRSMEKERDEAKTELERLRSINQQLNWVKVAVSGSEKEMDEMLADSVSAGFSSNIPACISVLRKELDSARKAIQSHRNEADGWNSRESKFFKELERRDNTIAVLNDEKNDWEEERMRMVKKMTAMSRMLQASKSGLPQTQIKRFIAESPAPQDLLNSPSNTTDQPSLIVSECGDQPSSLPTKKPCLQDSLRTPESLLRRNHSADLGPLNVGKKAGNRAENVQPARPKLVKSIFGSTTPSPVAPSPLRTALQNPMATFNSNVLKKGSKRKNYFASKFEPENEDIVIIN